MPVRRGVLCEARQSQASVHGLRGPAASVRCISATGFTAWEQQLMLPQPWPWCGVLGPLGARSRRRPRATGLGIEAWLRGRGWADQLLDTPGLPSGRGASIGSHRQHCPAGVGPQRALSLGRRRQCARQRSGRTRGGGANLPLLPRRRGCGRPRVTLRLPWQLKLSARAVPPGLCEAAAARAARHRRDMPHVQDALHGDRGPAAPATRVGGCQATVWCPTCGRGAGAEDHGGQPLESHAVRRGQTLHRGCCSDAPRLAGRAL
mmetsp:Transcript_8922/g.27692  ORF Transcript_8922/g.27692 Transcript_8922/m.27692 type:complete len:262 (+) Transcript_8922:298-1083(+)